MSFSRFCGEIRLWEGGNGRRWEERNICLLIVFTILTIYHTIRLNITKSILSSPHFCQSNKVPKLLHQNTNPQHYKHHNQTMSFSKYKQYENIESFLFQIDGSNFSNFDQMQTYLDNAEKSIEERITELSSKMDGVQEELKRTAGVYQFNNKKRQKEEEYLEMEREKLLKKMEEHKKRLNVTIHPITLILREKKNQIEILNQTKQIIQDFNKIMNGKEEELAKILPLDQKNFNNSALKVYVFKCLLEEMTNEKYEMATIFIKKKFLQLKTKILSNFKEGFLKKDVIILNNILPYCEEYELMDQISDYYNLQAFKQSHPLQKIEKEMISVQIQNYFFLLRRGFQFAFSSFVNGNQKNGYKVSFILPKYNDFISRRLISFVFEKIIKETIDSILKCFEHSADYLLALELFYIQCKNLAKECEGIIQDDKIVHLMQTYMESIFDIYLENYINKEVHSLGRIYEENIGLIVQQMRAIDALQQQEETRKDSKKFSFKKLMDYKIETKKQYNAEYVKSKLQALSAIFMDPSLQKLFESTKYALNRNNKISKINEIDRNRNQILTLFLKELGELINTIITSMRDVLPSFQENSPPLQHQFFQVIPQVNVLLQRMECLYSQYKKQATYELSQSIKLQQKKEDLIAVCSKNLNKIVADALACILTTEKSILRERAAYMQSQQEPISSKMYLMLEKYVKAINNRINQFSYRESLLKTLGVQFVNLLIQHYSTISYSKQGLGGIFVDVSGFGKILKFFTAPIVQERFRVFKSLIDIYVLKNDEKQLSNYIKSQKQGILTSQKDQVIRAYIQNKQRVQKNMI